jgi:hypothetical protein
MIVTKPRKLSINSISFIENVDRVLNQNKDCKFGRVTGSNKILNIEFN